MGLLTERWGSKKRGKVLYISLADYFLDQYDLSQMIVTMLNHAFHIP